MQFVGWHTSQFVFRLDYRVVCPWTFNKTQCVVDDCSFIFFPYFLRWLKLAYLLLILEKFVTILRKIFEISKVSLLSSFCEMTCGRVQQTANTDSCPTEAAYLQGETDLHLLNTEQTCWSIIRDLQTGQLLYGEDKGLVRTLIILSERHPKGPGLVHH